MVNWELNSCCNNGQVTFLVTIGVFTVVILVPHSDAPDMIVKIQMGKYSFGGVERLMSIEEEEHFSQ
ncbi:hypothetical protein GOBAR_DD11311 [Gossypium barbadense]|nr:hypothetical protein GOBAR_DD11311 [Gossypium barbadense]